jgi:hypothetical protein
MLPSGVIDRGPLRAFVIRMMVEWLTALVLKRSLFYKVLLFRTDLPDENFKDYK